MVLNVAASRRTSGGPEPTSARVSSTPLPSRLAASASEVIGRLAHRARLMAITTPASRPAADTAAMSVHSTVTRWS